MIKFAIRDDDISFFTNTTQLQKIYTPIFQHGFKVSFSVIPKEAKTLNKNNRQIYKQLKICKYIENNKILVKYLQSLVKSNSVEIMLHGFDHRYKILNNNFIGEAKHKDGQTFRKDILHGINYLNNLFNIDVVSFVPPSNQISINNFKILENSSIKYISGTINPVFNRPINKYSIANYLKYILFRTIFGFRYPYILKNNKIKEVTYYSLSPTVTLKSLIKQFNFCIAHRASFVLATHHWELASNKKLLSTFYSFINYVDRKNINKCIFKNIFN